MQRYNNNVICDDVILLFCLHLYLKASIEQLLKKIIYNCTKWQLLISLPHTLDLFHSAHLLGNLHMQQKR